MNTVAKKLQSATTSSSNSSNYNTKDSTFGPPNRTTSNNIQKGAANISSTPTKSNKSTSMSTSTDHTSATVSTSKSASTCSVPSKLAAKVEQKQKIAEAKSINNSSHHEGSSAASTKNNKSSKAGAEQPQKNHTSNSNGNSNDRRRQSTTTQKSEGSNSHSSVELAKKDFPQEIEVPPHHQSDRRKSEISAKTDLTDEEDRSKESSSKQQQTAEHYVKEQYGLSELPTEDKSKPTEEVELRYARALCFAIGRAYSQEQQEWILGDLGAKGYSQYVLDQVPTFLKQSCELMDLEVATESKKLITGDLRQDATMLVYDMYRAAVVNDFPSEQEVAIAMIAEEIGVDGFGQLEEIKKQVQLEEEVKRNRIKLLHSGGRDNLDERYEDVVEEEKTSKEDTNRRSSGSNSKAVSSSPKSSIAY